MPEYLPLGRRPSVSRNFNWDTSHAANCAQAAAEETQNALFSCGGTHYLQTRNAQKRNKSQGAEHTFGVHDDVPTARIRSGGERVVAVTFQILLRGGFPASTRTGDST